MRSNSRPKFHVKKGDMVMVIAGRDRGKVGKVLHVHAKTAKVTVEKINIIKRHTKPTAKNRQGGILEREAPLAISNVLPYCERLQRPSRVRVKILDDGRKVRVYQKAPDEVLDKET
ncbi:MAG: 50S ribosomal protein L24 [Nitrospirae bacterium]|nr:MAG: 50S ribosomal protein L24 [Nitrospirota bacterium]